MKTAKPPQEARATPGLKLLTPFESAPIKRMTAKDRERWKDLLARNKLQPTPILP